MVQPPDPVLQLSLLQQRKLELTTGRVYPLGWDGLVTFSTFSLPAAGSPNSGPISRCAEGRSGCRY